jgi:hypothetical protein
MQRGLWNWTRKDSLWHEMSGDVKVRRLLGVFFFHLTTLPYKSAFYLPKEND